MRGCVIPVRANITETKIVCKVGFVIKIEPFSWLDDSHLFQPGVRALIWKRCNENRYNDTSMKIKLMNTHPFSKRATCTAFYFRTSCQRWHYKESCHQNGEETHQPEENVRNEPPALNFERICEKSMFGSRGMRGMLLGVYHWEVQVMSGWKWLLIRKMRCSMSCTFRWQVPQVWSLSPQREEQDQVLIHNALLHKKDQDYLPSFLHWRPQSKLSVSINIPYFYWKHSYLDLHWERW